MTIELVSILPNPMVISFVYPILSMPMVAALTPENISVNITEVRNEKDIQVKDIDLVGISALTYNADIAYKIADMYREKGIKVVLGGIHVSTLPDEALMHCDAVVIGEAEKVWTTIIEDIQKGTLKDTYKADELADLSILPETRLDLMDKKNHMTLGVIHATRGCPFNCYFCCVTEYFGRKYRFRPVDTIVEEIQNLKSKGLAGWGKFIIFNDDNIAGNRKYAKELFTALKELNIKWSAQTNLFIAEDDELLDLASKSGCIDLFIGIESINDENLTKIGKTMNKLQKYEDDIKKIKSKGITVTGAFILGLDYDDESSFERTIRFIEKNDIDIPVISVLTPFPGTRLYKELENDNRIIDRDWSKYDLNHVVFKPKLMSPEVLDRKYNECYRIIRNRIKAGLDKKVKYIQE
ncbi:MAG: B12-binding domain-containing radical SAM protein [Spirochaetales bacterium]|nr:B12-binding domain-containing radical SAM protein [Spirochaetales bacterium]